MIPTFSQVSLLNASRLADGISVSTSTPKVANFIVHLGGAKIGKANELTNK